MRPRLAGGMVGKFAGIVSCRRQRATRVPGIPEAVTRVELVSFVVPAHNEELLLPRALEAIAGAGRHLHRPHEVIVVDDASDDRTAEIASGHGARVIRAECRQIAGARNAGARAARGDLLIFVDADTAVSPGAVRGAVGAIEDGATYGGGQVIWDGRIPLWSRGLLSLILWMYARIGLASGAFLFARREAFERIGGFDEAMYAGEEACCARALRREGRFAWVREPVITSGRKLRAYSAFELFGTLFRMGIRGKRGVARRDGLELWYGPRRADPDPEVGDEAMRLDAVRLEEDR